MRQRFGLATALLGDPGTLILDEPFNGLDPEGIRWLRDLLQGVAGEGRTVMVSSHLLSEMSELADRVLVIGRGELIADTTMAEFTGRGRVFRVTCSDALLLARALRADGGDCSQLSARTLDVSGVSRDGIAFTAAEQAIEVFEVLPQGRSLEETFVQLTQDAVEYRGSAKEAGCDGGPDRGAARPGPTDLGRAVLRRVPQVVVDAADDRAVRGHRDRGRGIRLCGGAGGRDGRGRGMPPIDAFLDPTHLTLSGVGLAQMAVACVGVMALSTEYGSGLIRSTLVAAPRRGRLFLAKAAALGLSTFAVMVPTAFTAFLVAREPLESLLGTAWPMDAVVVRALLGTGIYLTGIALLGLAAAALVRYTAGGIGVVFVLLFVLPMLPLVLPVSARETVEAFLPADAGSRLMKVTTPDAVLNAGTGALVFGIYIIMALVAAWAVLSRRDIR